MIPVKLTIEGLYSYQKKQTIDFTRLTATNIFGIFGQVGSGKSSILEAISYSLYGDTERLNSKEGRGYNMMNLKSDNLFVEFEFISGIDHKRYMVVVSARRNSKRFEDVKAIDRKAFVDDSGLWIPVEVGELERAVGLSYSNFKRTIIIPQGKFQEFLQLEKKERTNMMKELFNLGKYDLYGRAASLDSKNKDRRQFLEGQLSSLGDITKEQVDELLTEQDKVKELVKRIAVELEFKRKELEECNRIKGLFIKRERLLQEQRLLDEKADDIARLEIQLQEYEYCLLNFKGLFEQEERATGSIKQLEQIIHAENEQVRRIQAEMVAANTELDKVCVLYEKRETEAAEIDDIKSIISVKKIDDEIDRLRKRTQNGALEIEKIQQVIDKQKCEYDALSINLKKIKDEQPDDTVLALVREWYATNRQLVAQQQVANREYEEASAQQKKVMLELDELAKLLGAAGTDANMLVPDLQLLVKKQATDIQEAIKQVDADLVHAEVQQKLGQFSDALHDGEACPLCGSVHHPAKLNVANVAEVLAELRSAKDIKEKQQILLNQYDKQLTAITARLRSGNDAVTLAESRFRRVEQEIMAHQIAFVWDAYKTEDLLNAAIRQQEEMRSIIKIKEEQQEKTAAKVKEDEVKLESYRKAIDDFLKKIASYEGSRTAVLDAFKVLKYENYGEHAIADLENAASERLQQLKDTVVQFEKLTNRLAELKVSEGKCRGSIDANEASLAKERELLRSVAKNVTRKLEESRWQSVDAVKQTLLLNINVEDSRTSIAAFRQSVQTINVQLLENEREFEGKSYDVEQHEGVERAVAELSEKDAAGRKEIGRIEREIALKQAALEQRKQVAADLEKVIQRAAELATLKNMLMGNRFIDFISTTYLQNLCAAANERFYRMTRQRLSLELTEDNSFQIRDYMNGGKTRSVKTLSGGQTFQASLSLALALSDNIQRMQSSDQNFFFLDEGFGTLDKESLSIVFDTLKSLRKENRIVGVISHVDEMQQEIETYLKVVNHEDAGSVISASWQ